MLYCCNGYKEQKLGTWKLPYQYSFLVIFEVEKLVPISYLIYVQRTFRTSQNSEYKHLHSGANNHICCCRAHFEWQNITHPTEKRTESKFLVMLKYSRFTIFKNLSLLAFNIANCNLFLGTPWYSNDLNFVVKICNTLNWFLVM